ncbi:hypothetical protein LHJ74_20420 [Streptomyces sp. N2-109]|uniref:Uncharacterized protein n=1 Tax=Streptomyces gossypii TaxID=2883101 RepID=A0ABT2JWF9_9ACTN|nr:hypothetical protein [Streptomyces gossypii]MCT2592238.1 hypothetical protein [Streptomyces gossypii]
MFETIRRTAARVREFLAPPSTGRHRVGAPAARPAAPLPLPLPLAVPAPRRRLPEDTVIDADELPIVRPYVTAYERRERRRALFLAVEGVDVGPDIIHGMRVGAAS